MQKVRQGASPCGARSYAEGYLGQERLREDMIPHKILSG